MNIKKIIAREGLILLGVLLVACVIFFISSIYPPHFKLVKTTSKEAYTREQFDVLNHGGLTNEQIVKLWKGQYPADITKKIENKEALTDEDVAAIDRIDEARAELDRRTEEKRGSIRWNGLLVLFIAYVFYLIPIRFSIWAIRTLKQKEL